MKRADIRLAFLYGRGSGSPFTCTSLLRNPSSENSLTTPFYTCRIKADSTSVEEDEDE